MLKVILKVHCFLYDLNIVLIARLVLVATRCALRARPFLRQTGYYWQPATTGRQITSCSWRSQADIKAAGEWEFRQCRGRSLAPCPALPSIDRAWEYRWITRTIGRCWRPWNASLPFASGLSCAVIIGNTKMMNTGAGPPLRQLSFRAHHSGAPGAPIVDQDVFAHR